MIEWFAVALTLLGIFFLGEMRKEGFLLGGLGNCAWVLAFPGEPSILVINVVLFLLNIVGYIKWGRE